MKLNNVENAMTVDVEDWYQTRDFNFGLERWSEFQDRVSLGIDKILDLFSRYDVSATFFILGCIAEKHPEVVKRIYQSGHEIGSHGMKHIMVTEMSKKEFRQDILQSKKILEDITGKEVNMYRAPTWSICPDTLWALEILEAEGIKCDSSMQPFKTPVSGISGIPSCPFYPVINGVKHQIIEFPSSVFKIFKRSVPFSGGFYLRALPYALIHRAIISLNKKQPAMVYVHPWELDTGQPVLNVPMHIKAVHYYNLPSTVKKLELLLKNFNFVSMGKIIEENDFKQFIITGEGN